VRASLEDIHDFINCQGSLFVVFKSSLIPENIREMTHQKGIVENKFTDILSLSDKNLADPAFQRFSEAHNDIMNQ
jgi:hypothetical protein